MRDYLRYAAFIAVFLCLVPRTSEACTTFCISHEGQQVFAYNLDWMIENGLVIINKRRVLKTAMQGSAGDSGPYARWRSKLGSITFNQYGREMPSGGMNEAGLVIHPMMLRQTQYPPPDHRPAINNLQWIK